MLRGGTEADMTRSRAAGVLWLIAGISSGGTAFFIVDPLTLAVFIVGGVIGIVLGLAYLVRPSERLVRWSTLAGVVWLVAFGAITMLNITNPIAEVLSVIWVAVLGVAGAAAAYRPRSSAA
jgi:hypothetical protein